MAHHFNDPDFDQLQQNTAHVANDSLSEKLPLQTVFFGGVLGGILVVCTIGFFILLTVFLRG